jgi:iron complex outermembrane receptor protein
LKANIASGFRAPNLAELTSNGAHEGTNRFEYGSQDLQSERSFQADLGALLDFEHISINLSGFYNRVNNFIYYSKVQSTFGGDSLVNIDGEDLFAFQFNQNNAQLSGLELDIDFHPHPLDWLHFQNKISYVRGSFIQSVEGVKNLPLVPAPRWTSELRGNFEKVGKSLSNVYMRFEADHNFRQNRPFLAYDTETETPSYTLLNAGFGADIQRKSKKIFSLHFTALNIADKAYQNHLSRLKYTDNNNVTGRQGVFNMGRNFSIKLNVPFSFNTKK